ncbi:PREDICTED: interferon-related developmental regulator 1-like [Tarenaya hassleriana]|uniref:interferon-related developmental regulator 1-like n=1 Tax=Tarenaya hassleriana TaxID=28532 RepID=UPI00053C5123|nr:PREDICTED: interferon-related developmental regulator 1-like [Tarenaya hassleriana]
MGKRSQRKNAAMFDSDDDTSSVSSSSTIRSDRMSVSGMDEVETHKDVLLDQALDALYEKRSSTREQALASIVDAFNSDLQHEFAEKKFATLLHQCVNCIKKGSSRETFLATHVIGLLAMTVGLGDQAHEILEESVTPLSQALRSGRDSLKISSILECLAIITFVGGTAPEETERSMQIIWQMIHPKLGANVVAAKPSPAVVTAVVSSWAFLLTTVDQWTLSSKLWQEIVSYLSSLLEKDDRTVRIAAGEALGLIFELGILEKFSAEAKRSNGSVQEGNVTQEALTHMHGLKAKVTNQVRDLSVEAGGKGSAKKDLNSQRNLFKDLLEFLEDGYSPESSTKIGGESLQTTMWCQMIQLNFLKHFLGGGFIKHMQDNEFLQDVFGFTPKKKFAGGEPRMSQGEKRMFRSPNSALSKARTQFLNKQRMLAESKNSGHYFTGEDD